MALNSGVIPHARQHANRKPYNIQTQWHRLALLSHQERTFLSSLAEILHDRWEWRKRILRLAIFELQVTGRGAALSWGWFFIRPLAYIACFWFAIGLGLRGGGMTTEGQLPYILWLSAGIIPWMYMREMLTAGSDSFRRRSALITATRTPLSCVTSIFSASNMFVQLFLLIALFLLALICGAGIDVYLLQLPVILVLMLVFWDMAALMLSLLGTVAKDFAQIIRVLSTPLFWISGIIFPVDKFPVKWMAGFFDINPITFFVSGYRCAFYDKTWLCADVGACVGFAVVFLVTTVVAVLLYSRFAKVVPDLV